MNKFAVGMITGGALLLAGAEYITMNKTARRKMMSKGKKIVDKAESALEDLSSEMFWKRASQTGSLFMINSFNINKFVRKIMLFWYEIYFIYGKM